MKKLLLSLSIATAMASCSVQQTIPSKVNVKDVSELNNATDNSLVYNLPATAVRVDIKVEKVISKVGPFYRYSQKMLNVTDVITTNEEEWRIKNVKISTYGVPDDSKRFAISYSGNTSAPFLNMTNDGILTGINATPVCVKSNLKSYKKIDIPNIEDVTFNDVPMLEKQLSKTSTAAMAEEAANFIYKVRKRRFKILASDYEQLPPDGQSYEVMVRELNKVEKQHMELFTGKQEVFTMTKSYYLLPNELSTKNDVLFRFSTVKGIVDKMDLSGAPVYIEIAEDQAKPLPNEPIIIHKKEEAPRYGLHYNRPGKVNIRIIDKNVLIKEQEVLLGQYGQVISMPASVLEDSNVSIQLDPVTGALKSINRK